METFSGRNKLVREYSGYGAASVGLRNRLLQLYGHPYSGNEFHFGVGNTNWIHENAFDKDLLMKFGKKVSIESFRDEGVTRYYEVFDFIEIYYARAKKDLDSIKRRRLLEEIDEAFCSSGSVYGISEDGLVVLKIEDKTAEEISNVDSLLSPFEEAQNLYREAVAGLIDRSKKPADVVKDICVVLEEYLQKVTGVIGIENLLKRRSDDLKLHPIQITMLEKLIAYRGDTWGPAHAGKGKKPGEAEALWFLEIAIAFIQLVYSKTTTTESV